MDQMGELSLHYVDPVDRRLPTNCRSLTGARPGGMLSPGGQRFGVWQHQSVRPQRGRQPVIASAQLCGIAEHEGHSALVRRPVRDHTESGRTEEECTTDDGVMAWDPATDGGWRC
jgi:hypothetical protein